MRTDELIRALATGIEPVPAGATARRVAIALLAGLPCAALLMMTLLGVQPALVAVFAVPMFWVKLGVPLALIGAGALHVARLARPGAGLGNAPLLIALPLAFVWLLALAALWRAPSDVRDELLLGNTWQWCPWLIAGLSLPTFAAALWALRGLAPTRLRLAGAAAGLLAGAVGAFVYAFHCPELAAPFIATWYVSGMLLPAAIGALIGPRLLRW